jgi:hypothetical protein
MYLRINKPVFIARMFDMHKVNERKSVGVEAMDVIVYLPEDRTYEPTKRRGESYHDHASAMLSSHRSEGTAIMFKGAEINMSDKNLRRLCKRLDKAKKSLVAYIRRMARAKRHR